MPSSLLAIYAAPLVLTMFWYLRRHYRFEKLSHEVHFEAKEGAETPPTVKF